MGVDDVQPPRAESPLLLVPYFWPAFRCSLDVLEPRQAAAGGGEDGETAAVVDDNTLRQRTARSVVTPWADLPYETQLSQKAEEARNVLKEITKFALKESSYNVPLWLKVHTFKYRQR